MIRAFRALSRTMRMVAIVVGVTIGICLYAGAIGVIIMGSISASHKPKPPDDWILLPR